MLPTIKKAYFMGLLLIFVCLISIKSTALAKNKLSPIYLSSNTLKGTVEEKEKEKSPLKAAIEFYENTRKLHDGLAEKGVIINLGYTNDTGFNLNGAIQSRTAVKSISLLDMSLNLDTERLGLWKGGNFFVLGQQIHGKSLTSNRIGDFQALSSIDAPNRIQLSEFGYEQSLFNEKFTTVIGKQDANNVFCALELGPEFINSSFALIPNIPMPTYPDQGLGVVSVITPVDWFNIKAGVFEGNPRGDELGFRSTFSKQGGFITMVEAAVTPEIKGHSGNYFVGFWSHSADIDEVYSSNPARYSNNYGIYTSLEQELFTGFNILGQFGWAPSDRNEITGYYGAGITYRGLFPGRNEDLTGIGVALIDLSSRFKQAENVYNEAAIEFFYQYQVTDSFALQPDVQVIINSGGSRRTALAIGLRSIFLLEPRVSEKL